MILHGFYGIVWYCMILHDFYGIVWYCMVLQDIAWYCIVFYCAPFTRLEPALCALFGHRPSNFATFGEAFGGAFDGLKPHDANARHSKIYAGKPVFAPG